HPISNCAGGAAIWETGVCTRFSLVNQTRAWGVQRKPIPLPTRGCNFVAFAVVFTRGLQGLDAPLVRVEVHVGGGLPQTQIVGLPEKEVREARDRVRAALNTANFDRPDGRVTVNLAPADLPKESGRFDLPIAIGILAATGQAP